MQKPVVMITGALAGIGRATALAFAAQGARVVVSGRREAEGKALAEELRRLGAEAEFIRADVRHEQDVSALVDGAVRRFGRLDVAVNNAGVEGISAPLIEHTPESFASVFETNVLGVVLSLKHELRVMQAQGSGAIINLSSALGQRPRAGTSVYSATKAAVESLTKTAALEGAPFGVRTNAVAPGPVDTELLARFAGSEERKQAIGGGLPLKRLGKPEEIADAIAYLASPQAAFITGQVLYVDGGRMVS